MAVESTTIAVLFVDICDSTRLYHQMGDTAAHALATNCLKIVSHATLRSEGKVVKNIGDGAMITFGSVEQAYGAAAHIQHALRSAPIKVKIGLHTGPVIVADGEVFGNTVNVAERVMGRAGPAEILMTRACVDTLSPAQRATVRLLDAPVVEHDPGTEIYRVLRETGGETTVAPETPKVREKERVCIIGFGGDVIRLDARGTAVDIGRDAACRIVLANDCTSRRHASIDAQGSNFVLTDRSTNGTYLIDAKGNVQFLRRESAVLTGRGSIAIGAPPRDDTARVTFSVEDAGAPLRERPRSDAPPLGCPAHIHTAWLGAGHTARAFQSWR